MTKIAKCLNCLKFRYPVNLTKEPKYTKKSFLRLLYLIRKTLFGDIDDGAQRHHNFRHFRHFRHFRYFPYIQISVYMQTGE